MILTANQIMKAAGGRMPVGQPATECEGAFVDSRDPVPGALFVGLRGATFDGGQYIADAFRGGAAAAIVSESAWMWVEGDALAVRKPVIVTKNPLAALQAAGRAALAESGARVVGITGAVGKTTTKDILIALLAAAGVRVAGTRGNRNTEVGVPLSLLGLPAGTEVAVIEMGMRGAGQIAELAALAPPDIACITAIAPVHLELLGTVEAVAAAKAELLAALRPGGIAVVPAGAPLLDPHLAALPAEIAVRRFGDGSDLPLGLIDLAKGWQRANAAAAVECLHALGVEPPPGPVAVDLSEMRGQERPRAGGGVLIVDCYNANPAAMAAALSDLAARPGRRVAVLGDMMELGAREADHHREVGRIAAELGIDLVIGVGERAAAIVAGVDGAGATRHFTDVDAAAAEIAGAVDPADIILIKGSRSMRMERLIEPLSE